VIELVFDSVDIGLLFELFIAISNNLLEMLFTAFRTQILMEPNLISHSFLIEMLVYSFIQLILFVIKIFQLLLRVMFGTSFGLGEDAFLLAAFGVGFGQFGVFLFGSA
jgi:hypothetical protein